MRSKEIAIVGAGKIGRGYLSDLFSRAGYHLIFINGSPVTIDKLNEQGYYTLFTAKADGLDKRRIEGFEAYSSKRDFDVCVERLQKVDLIAVALYPGAYPSVADLLAKTNCQENGDRIGRTVECYVFREHGIYGKDIQKIAARTAG